MTREDFKFPDCRKCSHVRINKARTDQVITETCGECDSGEFYEERRPDTVTLISRGTQRDKRA